MFENVRRVGVYIGYLERVRMNLCHTPTPPHRVWPGHRTPKTMVKWEPTKMPDLTGEAVGSRTLHKFASSGHALHERGFWL